MTAIGRSLGKVSTVGKVVLPLLLLVLVVAPVLTVIVGVYVLPLLTVGVWHLRRRTLTLSARNT